MQRTNASERRAAVLFVGGTLGVITLVCLGFLVVDVIIPEAAVVVGRWIPALVALVVMRIVGLPGDVGRWWGLRPRGWRRTLVGCVIGMLGLAAIYLAAALLTGLTGQVQPLPAADLAAAAVWLLPYALIFSLSTIGEEAGWRGFLQRLLAAQGFWRMAAIVSGVWVAFHVPLHGVMVLQGTLPLQVALATTAGLFPLGLLLSALVARFGSVWPAVLAHAMPLSALNLVRGAGDLAALPLWLLTAVTALLLAGAAAVLARGRLPVESADAAEPQAESASS
ncbi:CPBP family intramembrane glutamic endopeptidase [Pseudactinotalea sp.]|uniref:CPBP family intramembrane glutamic endopeptidase n=1 Tax=Pseudactinotalea sp. TaxID=1926260 RepID=UPI003B3A4C58